MSTRSGKRIHSTVFERTVTEDSEVVTKLDKKTRNKRFKENDDHQDAAAVALSKKQKHYVGYPTDDEGGYVTATDVVDCAKSSRKSKKNTLKEHDMNVLGSENTDAHNEEKKTARVTRQTRKFADNIDDGNNLEAKAAEEPHPNGKVKIKKNKKKRSRNSDVNENVQEAVQDVKVEKVSKKSKKKNKGKSKKTSTEDVKQMLNKSNISTDSFHSAAGSPTTVVENMDVDIVDDKLNTTLVKEDEPEVSKTSKKDSKKKRNSILKATTPKKEIYEQEIEIIKAKKTSLKNNTDEKEISNTDEEVNKATENNKGKNRRASLKTNDQQEAISVAAVDLNSTYDKIDVEEDNTPEKVPKARRSLRLNDSATVSSVNIENKDIEVKLNATFEKDTKSRRSVRSNNSTTENGKDIPCALNTTYEKSLDSLGKAITLNSTFDKSATKMNTTFDKIEPKQDSGKSSLISSDDGTINVTFDKDNSRISITSDESNIVNTTPVLIESSLDESRLSVSRRSKSLEVHKDEAKTAPVTPLKREGTFTKESPEVIVNKTPTKRQTLPSPGFTPFHVTRSSNKEKSVLNVTRSLEKPARRSSLADMAPTRQTRVMFCSPMNNPAVVSQLKKKVIKSSMKGSNKSFVFEDNAPSALRPSARKRSYTQDDAGNSRAKRTRLAEDLQLSVDRLSRPRTSSASAKLPDTTPSKPTPSKPKTEAKRTKLPNFAALHQKQFDKMESLSECQQRKMRRAKKLLVPKTPNGTVMVLERSSPKGTANSPKPKEVVAKKSETPVKPEASKNAELSSKVTKLPTLESLRPGFTRFGFKMNTDFNPFSVPSKSDTKPNRKAGKQNGVVAKPVSAPKTPAMTAVKLGPRQPTLPSLNGVTTTRKEAAKQAVMREKSFTSLGKRDAKRNECRTIIKGVRTNRRFELQMKMRNID